MGCGASAKGPPRELTDEEKQTICCIACKEMETITCKYAISEFESIIVVPPNEVNQFRANAERCREAGESVKDSLKDMAEGGQAEAMSEKVASGGMLGGMAKMAGKALDKAAEAGGDAAGKLINQALFTAAKGMDTAVDAIQKPFTEVGRDIVKAKQPEIVEIFVQYINKWKFPEAYKLCRGQKGDAISLHMTVAMVKPLANALLPIVQTEINKHAVTKAWDLAIEETNKMINLMKDKVPDLMDKYGPKPIELDINIHIVTKVIEQIAFLMGKKEIEVRQNPAGKSTKPFLFEAVFTPDTTLTVEHLECEHSK